MTFVPEPHRVALAERPRRGCPALFLDRDGTLIEDPGYVSRPEDVRLIPGAAECLRRFHDAGHALVVVTNQSGIGRGLYGWADYDAVSTRFEQLYREEGILFDSILACGHPPEEGDRCGWRKPAPGMIHEAVALLRLDLKRSTLVGDKLIDMQAAEAGGVPRGVHVATGQGARERPLVDTWRPKVELLAVDSLAALAP